MNWKNGNRSRSLSSEDGGRAKKLRKLDNPQVKLSKENDKIERTIKELEEECQNRGDDLARMTYLAAENRSRRKSAEEQLYLQSVELEEARAEIEELKSQRTSFLQETQELRSKAKRVDKLEKDLESLRSSNSRQEKAVTKKLLEIAESLKEKRTSLEVKCESLSSKVEEYESINPGVTPAVLKDEYHHLIKKNEHLKAQLEVLRSERDESSRIHVEGKKKATSKRNAGKSSSDRHQSISDSNDGDESLPSTDIEREKRNLSVMFGGYKALVSDAKYFEFDWEKYCKCLEGSEYSCRKCPREFSNDRDMQDHVWCEHYGGSFKCFYCKHSSRSYTLTHSFKHHMKERHSNVS